MGVRFARAAEKVTLLDILNAVENQKPLFQTSFEIKAKRRKAGQPEKNCDPKSEPDREQHEIFIG
jgi:DNA-binding IscR family transcriptional regulator